MRAKELLQAGVFDYDLVQAAYFLGLRNRDPELAILALESQIKTWPSQATDGWLKLGNIYDSVEAKNEIKAQQAYAAALAAAPPAYGTATWAMIPPNYRAKIRSGANPH